MALSDPTITGIAASVGGDVYSVARFENIKQFAQAIEAEVRKQDDALIQHLLNALETCYSADDYNGPYQYQFHDDKAVEAAITAARARLGEKA